MADAPAVIQELVDRYSSNRDLYRSAAYNEEQTRAEFINPFFEALGWDVRNKAGYSPAYMDVVFEGTLRVEGSANAPDYTFRVGQTRKFFAEAKKPNVVINLHPDPARQIRRYSWTAKLPLGILTNFAELAVYDCRVPPKPTDQPSYARLKYIKYTEYPERWDEIASIFSRDAVWKGSFDKYVVTEKGKRGTAEVDDEFLKQIEEWRTVLARNLALRNPRLDVRELNYAVQNTIDRIVFLRICEDRGIEPQGQLKGRTSGPNVYGRLVDLYISADHKYNSGLFHFSEEKGRTESPDILTTGLKIDDKVLKDIIAGLYYPKSPYEFSVIGAEILGSVYEQFLGKVIRLTPAHTAVVEEKPEVKKAGGVYYTPVYIVDYIVQNTVGKLCEGKTPKQVEKLRIVDPACGSGSFLINAYAWLLNWHLDYYVKDGPENHKKEVYRVSDSAWRLATKEKKRILLNNIYGVDIDSQAVEVTKLSLLLKVLEGESRDTLDVSLAMFHERALPDLSNNITCGNSLIGTDFDTSGLSEDEVRRINPFDWTAEFPAIMHKGGFDAVIGNPPWGAALTRQERNYLTEGFPDVADHESAQYFLMRALELADGRGYTGMIIPNTFALNVYARNARNTVLSKAYLTTLCDLSDIDVFSAATVRSIIVLLTGMPWNVVNICQFMGTTSIRHVGNVQQDGLKSLETWAGILVPESPVTPIVQRLTLVGKTLADYCEVRQGYIPYRTTTLARRFGDEKAAEIVRTRAWHSDRQLSPEYTRELQGADVQHYAVHWSGTWVRYGEWVSTYLPMSVFTGPRVLVREITGKPPHVLLAAYTDDTFVHNPSALVVLPRPSSVSAKFVLGLLNSRAMSAFFLQVAPKARKGLFPKIIITDARRLPMPDMDLSLPAYKARHDKMVKLVDRMLDLHKKLDTANVPGDKTAIQRQIDSTDREIDNLVYELYGLTEDEIKIVEESA